MLTLTDRATDCIHDVLDARHVPAAGGVRIAIHPQHGFVLAIETEPASDDYVVGAEGARVFLDPACARVFDDIELDAAVRDGQLVFEASQRRHQ